MEYLDTLNEEIRKYFKILSKEFTEFLNDYINTPEMQRQAGISVTCGTIYSKMYNQMWYSSLDHSVAVALIIWNFTKDKKQTISLKLIFLVSSCFMKFILSKVKCELLLIRYLQNTPITVSYYYFIIFLCKTKCNID
ncbi:MAG: hypothetical protein HFJ53_08045 [Clostridia bacterium]|nr:hypothetical protein [Clostridia bacterium]